MSASSAEMLAESAFRRLTLGRFGIQAHRAAAAASRQRCADLLAKHPLYPGIEV